MLREMQLRDFRMKKEEIAQIIRQEIEAGGYPFPPELFDSLVEVESNWKPGIVNPTSGALGLTQIMPITLKEYNKYHVPGFTRADLTGKTIESARKQIQAGLWVLGQFWRGAYNYLQPKLGTLPVDELVKIADLFYVAGPGATKRKLRTISPPTYDMLKAKYPNWVAFKHPTKVWNKTTARNPHWDLRAIDDWVSQGKPPIVAGFNGTIVAFVLASLILSVGWSMLKSKTPQTEEE